MSTSPARYDVSASVGAVQVGMLRAVAEAGIVPDVIVGTSSQAGQLIDRAHTKTAAWLARPRRQDLAAEPELPVHG